MGKISWIYNHDHRKDLIDSLKLVLELAGDNMLDGDNPELSEELQEQFHIQDHAMQVVQDFLNQLEEDE